jgi:hypothetical protein
LKGISISKTYSNISKGIDKPYSNISGGSNEKIFVLFSVCRRFGDLIVRGDACVGSLGVCAVGQ